MTPDDICLAVDLGTGGPKVGFVRLSGEILWHEHQPVETHWLPGGGATQDAVAWWALIRDAVRRGLASGAVPAAPSETAASLSATASSGWTRAAAPTPGP